MTQVLLLNANMVALKTVSLQRAISLISKNRVDVIETDPDRKLRSPSVTWDFPLVLRLRYYANVPKRKAVWSRRGVFARDGYVCSYCGRKLSREEATIDHIIPVSKCKELGVSSSTWTNTCCACKKCNLRKSSKTPEEAGMKFYDETFIARTPRTNYIIASGEVPDCWRVYLEV